MPVTVTSYEGTTTFDNADGWNVDAEFGVLDVVKVGDATVPDKILASFAMGSWKNVKRDPKQDRQLQFEEALELIGLVDSGNFGHQDSDWVERAESLLSSNR